VKFGLPVKSGGFTVQFEKELEKLDSTLDVEERPNDQGKENTHRKYGWQTTVLYAPVVNHAVD